MHNNGPTKCGSSTLSKAGVHAQRTKGCKVATRESKGMNVDGYLVHERCFNIGEGTKFSSEIFNEIFKEIFKEI